MSICVLFADGFNALDIFLALETTPSDVVASTSQRIESDLFRLIFAVGLDESVHVFDLPSCNRTA